MNYTADAIATTLESKQPTPEQASIIEYAGRAPALVLAGAGSGKTETMASRVVWLVANRVVDPASILGLTFTRKAARELRARVHGHLRRLRASGLVDFDDELELPEVTTYNSFANQLFRENALRLGREPDSQLLTDAGAWQLAHSIVLGSDDPRMSEFDVGANSIADRVIALSHAMVDNDVDQDRLKEFSREFAALIDLPQSSRGKSKIVDRVGRVMKLDLFSELAEEFEARKRRRSLIEYSDQVALALQAAQTFPEIVAGYQSQYRCVLLDEYQDTSVSQSALLSTLFRDSPVMAVGDPHQSIYGWRGASASNLEGFARDFSSHTTSKEFTLSTSWRSDRAIVDVANVVTRELAERSRVHVEPLKPRPGALDGRVDARFTPTILDEAEVVAAWLKERLAEDVAAGGPSTSAVLFRNRTHMAVFADALSEQSIPYELVGFGGALESPEVVDLVAELTVVVDPSAGSELLRLLAGARWRIGVADLEQLRIIANMLRRSSDLEHPLDEETRRLLRQSTSADDAASIVDAVDAVSKAPSGSSILDGFSDLGLERLRAFGLEMQSLRQRSGLGLVEFIEATVGELGLDVELLANPGKPRPLANLNLFVGKAREYQAVAIAPTLSGFLGWINQVKSRERISPEPAEIVEGTVQLLTVHAAKGLEWDHVVVPRLAEGVFPSEKTDDAYGWVRDAQLPYELRRDYSDLPKFSWRNAESQETIVENLESFKNDDKGRRMLEERRVAYVAFTRAKKDLLLSGSYFANDARSAKEPSVYLTELAEAGLIDGTEFMGDKPSADSIERHEETLEWPFDPLGARRDSVEHAAELVRAAGDGQWSPRENPWRPLVEALLSERDARRQGERTVPVPERVPASRFKDFVNHPEVVAAAYLRPMPQRPYTATRLGTLFHEWVERRYASAGASGLFDDELIPEDDIMAILGPDQLGDGEGGDDDIATMPIADVPVDEETAERLKRLQHTFEGSRWASMRPVDVEREIVFRLAGQQIVCKLDAVFETDRGYQIVDWKTGRSPKNSQELRDRQLQLALYRFAYADWKGVPTEAVEAILYYVAEDKAIHVDESLNLDELTRLWSAVLPQTGVPSRSGLCTRASELGPLNSGL